MSEESMTPEEILDGIRNMRIRGAAEIGRKASLAIRLYAERSLISDKGKYVSGIKRFAKDALSTRPTAVTLWSGVTMTVRGVEEARNSDEVLERVRINSERFISESKLAIGAIAEMAAKRVPNDATILTHCNSTAAVATILRAHELGKVKMVYATESRPKRQGLITARQLSERNVPVTLIVDSAARYHMKSVDIVIVGADAVASNGAVINKIGTSQIALIAHERRVPFMVCAETIKFSPHTFKGELVKIEERDASEVVDLKDYPGVAVSNPVFDATPADYIDAIVTEVGVIPATAAYEIVLHNEGVRVLSNLNFSGGKGDAV
jgi:ribose 1,5-bisphosphate isomerase